MGKIKFHPFFIIYVFLCIYFNWFNDIFYYIVTIVLHEYGHYFLAKKKGYETYGIVFNVYGAGLNSSSIYKKKDDVLISLAGPLVNLCLIVLIIMFWWIFPTTYLFTYGFFKSNLIVMIFNLLPIYPLDGGRVIIAFLSMYFNRKKILKINKIIGCLFGVFFILLFLISLSYVVNFSMLFIGIFLIMNYFISEKNNYFDKAKSFNKTSDVCEVKIFKVKDFDKRTLLKYVSPNYYSVFISEKVKGYRIKSEIDLIN